MLAARALGARDWVIIGRHILPNTLSPLIVQATITFPIAILAEAALSYLGLGTQPPHPSWGLMLPARVLTSQDAGRRDGAASEDTVNDTGRSASG